MMSRSGLFSNIYLLLLHLDTRMMNHYYRYALPSGRIVSLQAKGVAKDRSQGTDGVSTQAGHAQHRLAGLGAWSAAALAGKASRWLIYIYTLKRN